MSQSRSKRGLNLRVHGGFLDYQVIFLVITLSCFGLLMIYSASSHKAAQIGTTSLAIMIKQAVMVAGGLVLMYLTSVFNYLLFRKVAFGLMCVSIFLSVIVLIIGSASHGSMRWIPLGPVHLQPSEVAKFCIAVYVADQCVSFPSKLTSLKSMGSIILLPGINMLLIAKENLSSAIISFAIAAGIMFIASPKPYLIAGVAAVGVIAVWFLIKNVGYRSSRLKDWLNPYEAEKGSQVKNAWFAAGSGGLFGRGLGQSIQKTKLPEAHNDMIFSVICEELGIFGAVCVIALFALLIIRLNLIARDSRDRFGGLLVSGIMVQIGAQAFINFGVATNLLPNTGMALPFISSGGSSIMVLMAEIGVVLNVSRQGMPYEPERKKRTA